MVLNCELRFQRTEWILFSVILLFVVLNARVGIAVTSQSPVVRAIASLYLCSILWITYPAIAIAVVGPVFPVTKHAVGSGDCANRTDDSFHVQLLMVCLSVMLTTAVPVLVSHWTVVDPLINLFIACESLRFSLKTMFFAYRKWNGSLPLDARFREYMLSFYLE